MENNDQYVINPLVIKFQVKPRVKLPLSMYRRYSDSNDRNIFLRDFHGKYVPFLVILLFLLQLLSASSTKVSIEYPQNSTMAVPSAISYTT